MPVRKILSEFVGTFALTFLVLISLATQLPLPTPLVAAFTLGLFVYLLGSVSGAHFNPAISVAMFSIKKLKPVDMLYYIVAQFVGAGAAMMLAKSLMSSMPVLAVESTSMIGFAEGLGAAFLAFAVTAATLKKIDASVSGLAVGGCLLLGILLASPFSNAVLNPAVAFGIGTFDVAYVLGPVIGAVLSAFLASYLHGEKVTFGR